jgi:mannitol-1-phosphate 5-dehydrogenase
MADHKLTGFGFGPIQSGLFAAEAYKSGSFSRIVAAEVDKRLVDAVRRSGGSYRVNVATDTGIETLRVRGIEIFDPVDPADRDRLISALKEATEIATALPSVNSYAKGDPSVASLIAEGIANSTAPAKIVYTAENDNQAAEMLDREVTALGTEIPANVQFLNTVIGKMSRTVTDPEEMNMLGLEPVTDNLPLAFLVEEFNRIMVTRTTVDGFEPGIKAFVQKADLLPFEEAKLYGHNAIHALLGYLGRLKGYGYMRDLKDDKELMDIACRAFIAESGGGLIKKHSGLGDPLFTREGYKEYAEDLLARMTNPYLSDTVERAARDPLRKLGYNDRLFGTMRLVLSQGVEPVNMALGAMAAIALLAQQERGRKIKRLIGDIPWQELTRDKLEQVVRSLWNGRYGSYDKQLIDLVHGQRERLVRLCRLGRC